MLEIKKAIGSFQSLAAVPSRRAGLNHAFIRQWWLLLADSLVGFNELLSRLLIIIGGGGFISCGLFSFTLCSAFSHVLVKVFAELIELVGLLQANLE